MLLRTLLGVTEARLLLWRSLVGVGGTRSGLGKSAAGDKVSGSTWTTPARPNTHEGTSSRPHACQVQTVSPQQNVNTSNNSNKDKTVNIHVYYTRENFILRYSEKANCLFITRTNILLRYTGKSNVLLTHTSHFVL